MKHLIVMLLLLSGCSVSITAAHVLKAKELCANNNGVKYISGNSLFGSAARDINVDCKKWCTFLYRRA